MSKRDYKTVKVLKLARFQTYMAKLLREFTLPLTPERDEIIIDIQLQLIELQALFNYLPTGLTIEKSDKAWSLLALLPHELLSHYKDFLDFSPFCSIPIDDSLKDNLGLIGVNVLLLEKETIDSVGFNKILEKIDETTEISDFVRLNYPAFVSDYCNLKLNAAEEAINAEQFQRKFLLGDAVCCTVTGSPFFMIDLREWYMPEHVYHERYG